MTAGIADTSVFIARESGRALDVSALPDDLAISIITIAELRAGVLATVDIETRDRRLATFSAAQPLIPYQSTNRSRTRGRDCESCCATPAGGCP